jgi:NAD(P)-dependent dehydrogenase (short-subunit alcohol dehydrogenase family)
MKQIALVTGANRGIGFEVCRQLGKKGLKVILSARNTLLGQEAVNQLAAEGCDVSFLNLDVTSVKSVREALTQFQSHFSHLDILINNAGGNYDYAGTPTNTDLSFARNTMELNLFSAWQMVQAFLPELKKSNQGRIVNLSSGAGSFADSNFGLAVTGGAVTSYGISKLALNGFTVKLASELKSSSILVNAVCPGFTATYPGAEAQGARPVRDGAASVVWAALLPNDGPSGKFFRDGKPINW